MSKTTQNRHNFDINIIMSGYRHNLDKTFNPGCDTIYR